MENDDIERKRRFGVKLDSEMRRTISKLSGRYYVSEEEVKEAMRRWLG